ncbi:MAG: bestrophin family ion channel, partial [Cyanobacteria bacterium P01_D01_bin.2]
MAEDRRPWFKTLLSVRGSVIRAVLPRVGLCTVFSVVVALLY